MTNISRLTPVLVPQDDRAHVSVARLKDYWYVACQSKTLKKKPLKRTILGHPIVLCRLDGKPAAFLDRCPHRNVPLSAGKVVGSTLECGYHGWRFEADGGCHVVPGLCSESKARGRAATAFPVIEQDGLVWVYCNSESEPVTRPWKNPLKDNKAYTTVTVEVTIDATMHAVIENVLDVPHTAYLHGGLFRKADRKRSEIRAVVRRRAESVEAEFLAEPAPSGLIGRLLAPNGGNVEHFDRFIMPSLAQVEYRLGDRNHVYATQCLTPESDFSTRCFIIVSFLMPLPGWLIRPFLEPVLWRILKQDARMLKLQTQNINHFGGERYVSTELDVLGPQIWQLLKNAERGGEPLEYNEREVTMLV